MKTVRVVLLALLLPWLEIRPRAAEPVLPLRTNDVIAFIGGANMVALAQSGHLETLLTLRHPHHKLRFRSLAWEGDTVFAQPRDVNYPDLVTQLKQVGATVAFVQFGQMESLAGEAGLTNFVSAYEQLLDRIKSTMSRVVIVSPEPIESHPEGNARFIKLYAYSTALASAAGRNGTVYADVIKGFSTCINEGERWTTDGMQFNQLGLSVLAGMITSECVGGRPVSTSEPSDEAALRTAIAEKNRLWFDYARPSNWAFLAGDRTEQAFSRDYRDRNIRAFAQEMQQFLPLIADAEKRIDELVAKAAAEKETTR